MNLYRVSDNDDNGRPRDRWTATRQQAQALMKQAPPVFRGAVSICQMQLVADQHTMLLVLNRDMDEAYHFMNTWRVWRGSARGGLVELDQMTMQPLEQEPK